MSKVKFYHLFADGVDSNGEKHTVTVVGKFTQEYVNGKLTFPKKTLHRKLTIGVAICNPCDKFDEEEGVRIGKSRIEKGKDAGSVETNDTTMLTEDLILAEMLGKLNYITTRIDKYVKVKKDTYDIFSQAIGI